MTVDQRYKTFGQRFLAAIVDGLVFIPFIVVEEFLPEAVNKWTFVGYNIIYIFCYTLYCVIGHGKYGQTLGKKVMKIKVLNLDEKNLIGYKRAFYREMIWFVFQLGAVIWVFLQTGNYELISREYNDTNSNLMMIISAGWLLVELATMLLNNKRRAVHDFIAGSVVVDLKASRKVVLAD